MVYDFKFGDVVEYKVEDKPCILAYPGSFRYSLIQPDASGRFVSFSVPIGAKIQPIESSSRCEYKLLKEIGDFLKTVRIDIIDNEESKNNSYQNNLTVLNPSSIPNMISEAFKYDKHGFSEHGFIIEVSELLYDMFYDDGVTIHVYTVGNRT